ncbi:hypothetical protein [Flavobacterium sp. H4147]|uniref:hypothetical protein n=1 Tax=Flavobacterium sp. H4147 TaxID=3034149 RepID=UPI0023EB166A|nr:hypothetical protein [Flavobacterium sp. H4147]
MSVQPLIPFKAQFVLSVKTSMYDFFENPAEVKITDKYAKVKDDIGNVDMVKFINYYSLSFSLYEKYKLLGLNYHQAIDVHPTNLLCKDERDSELSFKLESSTVEVLQIVDGKMITFSNYANEVCTIELSDNLKLIKV